MGLIEMLLAAVGAILLAAFIGGLGQQAADEFKAWTPRMVRALIRRAARRLPPDLRTRMEEEWSAHAADVPGEVGKILSALGFAVASFRIVRPCEAWRRSPLFAPLGSDRRVIGAVTAAIASFTKVRPMHAHMTDDQMGAMIASMVRLKHVVRLRRAALYDLLHPDNHTWGSELGKITAELLAASAPEAASGEASSDTQR